MIACMVCHARLGKTAPGVYVAVYRSGRRLMPGNVEGRQFGKERQSAVWQMIMDPPNMPGKVRFIARAVVFLFVPELVDFT